MRLEIVRLGALVSGTLALVWTYADSGSDASIFEPAQVNSPLFNNEAFRQLNMKVDATGSSVNVAATVHGWARPKVWTDVAMDGLESLSDMVTFTSTAYADDEITSAQSGTAGSGPEGCSTENGTKTGDVTQCSTNQNVSGNGGDGGQGGYGAKCSTSSGGSGFGGGTQTCSAYVDPDAELDPGSNNTACSALGKADGSPIQGTTNCSAGAETGAVACSTAGGQSPAGSSDGAVVCSANGGQADGNTCSTSGGDATVTCSTYSGEHQACSAGQTAGTNDAECSTSGSTTGDAQAMCSVNSAGTGTKDGPADGTKCTAIAYGAASGSEASCSTDQGAGGDGTCSVAASNTTTDGTGGKNTQCTVIPQGDNAPPDGYFCSASGVEPDDNTTCSVLADDGGKFQQPNASGICGDPIHNHEDP